MEAPEQSSAAPTDFGFESRSAISEFLFVAHAPAPVDVCLVLGAPNTSNVQPAVDLYRRGLVQKLVMSGLGPGGAEMTDDSAPECERLRQRARADGVPHSAILCEDRSTNTRENFEFSAAVIERELGWEAVLRAAVCGKPLHMRRALMTARRFWPSRLELIMLPSKDPGDLQAHNWWHTEGGRVRVLRELEAIGTYALKGDLAGF